MFAPEDGNFYCIACVPSSSLCAWLGLVALSGNLTVLVNSLRVYMAAVKQSANLHQGEGASRAARLLNSDKALIPAIKY